MPVDAKPSREVEASRKSGEEVFGATKVEGRGCSQFAAARWKEGLQQLLAEKVPEADRWPSEGLIFSPFGPAILNWPSGRQRDLYWNIFFFLSVVAKSMTSLSLAVHLLQ